VRTRVLAGLVSGFIALFLNPLLALGDAPQKIQDNSFLIEEAYNQERGVVQHIQTYQYLHKAKTWLYTFTQEWPVPGQTHQLSYTIPVDHLNDGGSTGIGDVALNYRYQLIMKEHLAVAPRFSVLLPTGDYKKGLGNGAVGYQTNLPVSVELSDSWVTHWNAGATFTPGAEGASGIHADTRGYNLGASIIWLTSENFNILTEALWSSVESVNLDGTKTGQSSFFINPGVRFAINKPSGLQIVPGFSFPIGIGSSYREYGMFLYLSFEHPLF